MYSIITNIVTRLVKDIKVITNLRQMNDVKIITILRQMKCGINNSQPTIQTF